MPTKVPEYVAPAPVPAPSLPPLPDVQPLAPPEFTPPAPQNALQQLAGLALIAQSNPEMLGVAFQQLEERRQAAEREAQLRFERELQGASFKAQEQERKAERVGRERAGKLQEYETAVKARQQGIDDQLTAIDLAIKKHAQEMQERGLGLQEDAHAVAVQQALDSMRKNAEETVINRRKALTGTARQPTVQQLEGMLTPEQRARVMTLPSDQADAYMATVLAAKGEAFREAFAGGAPGLTISKLQQETNELLSNNPAYLAIARRAGLTSPEQLFPGGVPHYLAEEAPEVQAAARDLTVSLMPYIERAEAPADVRHRVGVAFKLLGFNEVGEKYSEELAQAITIYWEKTYDLPREQGETIINRLINDYATDEEIDMVLRPTAAEATKETEAEKAKLTKQEKRVMEARGQISGAVKKVLTPTRPVGLGAGGKR